jgi:hypothetical protein
MAELFELTGMDLVRQRLETMRGEMLFLAGIALQQEADAILEASQPLVPVDTGSLRASGKVDPLVITGSVAQSSVRYGGTIGVQGRVPERYAARIEFDVTLRHPRGGQAHFLSEPTFAATSGMLARIAEQVRNAL